MFYKALELKENGSNYYNIKNAIKSGKLFKVAHGIYSDKSPYLSELENIFLRYPNAVLTLESAFAIYAMSDYVPNKYVVATSQKAHRIKNEKVEQVFITKDLLNVGKVSLKFTNGYINIYDKERLLIELFRFKSRLSYSYYKEIISSYRKLVANEELDLNKVNKYCSFFKRGDTIKKQILEIIL